MLKKEDLVFRIGAAVLLFLVGICYFYGLKSVPGGLFPDAAANGLDANLILTGQHSPFFERGNGREALFSI